MDEAYAILEWMWQNNYSLPWVAECIEFSPEALSKALETKCISHRLADALHKHFGLRIIADGTQSVRGGIKDGALQVWRREAHRRRIGLKSKAIDPERYRTDIKRPPEERNQNKD